MASLVFNNIFAWARNFENPTFCVDLSFPMGTAGGRSMRARVPYVARRAVSVSSILIISNTVSGLVGGAPLRVPEAFVDICFQKNTIISPARQRFCVFGNDRIHVSTLRGRRR